MFDNLDWHTSIVATAWGVGLAVYSLITHNILVFVIGVIVGVILDAGIKYFLRAFKYEKGGKDGRKRRRDRR